MMRPSQQALLEQKIQDLERQLDEAHAALRAHPDRPVYSEFRAFESRSDSAWRYFRNALDSIPAVVVIYDRNLRIQYINQATENITGRPVSDFLGKLESEVFPAEVLQTWQPTLRGALESGEVQTVDIRFQPEGMEERCLHITCVPLADETGSVREVMGITEDVTERTRATAATQEAHALLKSVTDNTNALIAATDTDLRFTFINKAFHQAFQAIHGVKIQVGDSLVEALQHRPEAQKRGVGLWERPLRGETFDVTVEFFDHANERRVYEMRFAPITNDRGEVVGATEIAIDVTQRFDAEKALQESETRYRSLFDNMSEGFALGEAICDENGKPYDFRFLAVNDAFERQSGLKPEIIGKPMTEVLPNLEAFWIETYCGVALNRKPVSFRHYNKDTNRYYDVYSFSPSEGKFAILFLDVTEQQQGAIALKESEERFRFVIENSLDVAYRRNLQADRYDYMSPVSAQVLGFTPEEMERMTFEEVSRRVHPDDMKGIETALAEAIEAGRGKLEYRWLHTDGEYRWVADHVTVHKGPDGKPLYRNGILRDITVRKRQEQALQELNEHLEERVRERTDELRKINEALQAEIEERKQIEAELNEIRQRIMDSVEEERLMIAREVHDGPMQELYALSYEILQLDSSMSPEEARETFEALQNRILEVNSTLRQISRGLRPPILDRFGLEKAIRDYTGYIMRDHHGLEVKLELTPDHDILSGRVRLALYRIFQTAMGNILRHSEANSAIVRLQLQDDIVVLEVEDDGKGFTFPGRWINLVREGHLGLVGANERAANVGGKLDIRSAPGKGTLLRVTAPCREK